MMWYAAISGWETWARAGNASEQTLRLRLHYLHALADLYRDQDPFVLTTDQLAAFVGRRGWAPETRKSARASVRALYRWAHATGRISADPSWPLPPVRVPPGRPRPIPVSLFADAVEHATPRTRLMLQLGRFEGLRRAEIAAVHRDDVADGSLRVAGKGGRVRLLPLHPVVLDQLEDAGPGWLFPSPDGGHLTAGHVGVLMSRVLPPGWTPHTLRHRAGTDWYSVERDLLAVQELLGHAKPETTRRYVEVPADARRRAVFGVAS